MARAAPLVLVLLLLAPLAARAEEHAGGALTALHASWADEAEARLEAVRADPPPVGLRDLEAAARGLRRAVERGEVLGAPPAWAAFRALESQANASREVLRGVNWSSDGDTGCDAASTCGRWIARTDAAANASAAAVDEAAADLRARWSRLGHAPALEVAVVAQVALDAARAQRDAYPQARAEVLRLRSYDPDSNTYQALVRQAWVAAHAPLTTVAAARQIADVADGLDEGEPLDPARVEERIAALRSGLAAARPLGEDSGRALQDARAAAANGTYPAAVASVLRYRSAAEFERLLFSTGEAADAEARLKARADAAQAAAEAALANATARGYEGLLLQDALAHAAVETRVGGAEAFYARTAASLHAALEAQELLLDPVVASAGDNGDGDAAPPSDGSSPRLAAIMAGIAGGTLVLVAATALVLRRKP